MAFVLLLVMLAACSAHARDLSDKMFTFPQETNTIHVRLTPSKQNLDAVTVCLRFFTDISREYGLFSMASPQADNAFLIYMYPGNRSSVSVRNTDAYFDGQDFPLNMWHSVCSTWDTTSGLAQLWINGNPSSRKFTTSGTNLNGPLTIILGQEQDAPGGKFIATQSFVGMISDVHMWDHVIVPYEIQNFRDRLSFTPGNVLNWQALEFQVVGRVLIEDQQH